MKTLEIYDERFSVTIVSLEPETLGHVIRNGENTFSLPHPSWTITGFSFHPWRNGIDLHVTSEMKIDRFCKRPIYVWDIDHGTTRRWGEKINSIRLGD